MLHYWAERLKLHWDLKMNRLVFAFGTMIYGIWPVHKIAGNAFAHLKANLKNKQYVIATYFYLRVWKQIFIGNGFLISIEMNMMTDNEYASWCFTTALEWSSIQANKKRYFFFLGKQICVNISILHNRERKGFYWKQAEWCRKENKVKVSVGYRAPSYLCFSLHSKSNTHMVMSAQFFNHGMRCQIWLPEVRQAH